MRAGGTIRFVRITTRAQVMMASLLVMLLGVWMIAIGLMLWRQSSLSAQQAILAAQRSAVSHVAAKANADKRSVDAVARELEKRQDAMDALMESHFGNDVDQSRVLGKDELGKGELERGQAPSPPAKISLGGATDRLAWLRARQERFAAALKGAATERLALVEAAIRDVGLNPSRLLRSGARSGRVQAGQGGPFIPAARGANFAGDRQLRQLSGLLDRLATMEAALSALPSGRPTMAPMLSSSYGYRRDPFNGLAAFHAGIDFPGAYGQPILAASEGRISFAGQRSGYGNCVEVDHGHGIVTRYAHLSGFAARVGDRVERGQQIARMGSTGRSTGTHLHFEVRVNGAAVDPRPFLEAKPDMLEARQDAVTPGRKERARG